MYGKFAVIIRLFQYSFLKSKSLKSLFIVFIASCKLCCFIFFLVTFIALFDMSSDIMFSRFVFFAILIGIIHDHVQMSSRTISELKFEIFIKFCHSENLFEESLNLCIWAFAFLKGSFVTSQDDKCFIFFCISFSIYLIASLTKISVSSLGISTFLST